MKRIKETYIYVLKDPNTSEVRYVGKSNEPKKRLSKHVRDCYNHERDNTHKQNWIRKVMGGDPNNIVDRPILEILEKVKYDKWEEREIYYINEYRKEFNLTNIQSGGSTFNPKSCKKVARINYITNDIEEIYESIAEAGRQNGYSSHARISDCCNGKSQRSMGYKWRFLDEDDNIIDNSFKEFGSKKIAKLNLELEILKMYPTLYSVRLDGYSTGSIYKICKGETRSDSGFIWRFVDEYNEVMEPIISYKKKTVAKYSLEGDYIETYLNVEMAGRENGLSVGQSIRNCVDKPNRTSCGFIWKYNKY